jgi:hypothetical protein
MEAIGDQLSINENYGLNGLLQRTKIEKAPLTLQTQVYALGIYNFGLNCI